eukprot:TRINITY_DN3300_c0_g1_i2.p1 TRINITY_DN3300_c0_g1~~TRINITY_DN3300_c0_g1_i2.p1  ORF type:complete len:710 (-),score=112.41 TRINITY_DN3300_c0_g1_i2:120-2249(-)
MELEPPPPRTHLRQAHVRQLLKTEMCKFFLMNRCGKGSECNFAHDASEIRSKPDLNRTSMCKTFLTCGNCDIPNCAFAHDERELRTTAGFFKTKMCRFASSGRCKHGASCRFAHDPQELPQPVPAGQQQLQARRSQPRPQAPMQADTPHAWEDVGRQGSDSQANARGMSPGFQMGSGGSNRRGARSTTGSDWTSDHVSNRDTGSDQSTRADTSASVLTPEGSGDSGPEEQTPAALARRNSVPEDRNRQRRGAERAPGRQCTTMMITNVPQFLTQGALVSLLEDLTVYMRGAFDFFYCPWDSKQDRNLGYAIVNFFARSVAAEFQSQWSSQVFLPGTPGAKRLRIVPAALQGRAANLRHFSGFDLARHVDPRFRPLVRVSPHEQLRPMAIAEEITEVSGGREQLNGSEQGESTQPEQGAMAALETGLQGAGLAANNQGWCLNAAAGLSAFDQTDSIEPPLLPPMPQSLGPTPGPESASGNKAWWPSPATVAAAAAVDTTSQLIAPTTASISALRAQLEQVRMALSQTQNSSYGRSLPQLNPFLNQLAGMPDNLNKQSIEAALAAAMHLERSQEPPLTQAVPSLDPNAWNNGPGNQVVLMPTMDGAPAGCGDMSRSGNAFPSSKDMQNGQYVALMMPNAGCGGPLPSSVNTFSNGLDVSSLRAAQAAQIAPSSQSISPPGTSLSLSGLDVMQQLGLPLLPQLQKYLYRAEA